MHYWQNKRILQRDLKKGVIMGGAWNGTVDQHIKTRGNKIR
jgi:hypothetical protein